MESWKQQSKLIKNEQLFLKTDEGKAKLLFTNARIIPAYYQSCTSHFMVSYHPVYSLNTLKITQSIQLCTVKYWYTTCIKAKQEKKTMYMLTMNMQPYTIVYTLAS